jgi:hypothetical protein
MLKTVFQWMATERQAESTTADGAERCNTTAGRELTKSDAASASVAPKLDMPLQKCPHCAALVRFDRLNRHQQKVHGDHATEDRTAPTKPAKKTFCSMLNENGEWRTVRNGVDVGGYTVEKPKAKKWRKSKAIQGGLCNGK